MKLAVPAPEPEDLTFGGDVVCSLVALRAEGALPQMLEEPSDAQEVIRAIHHCGSIDSLLQPEGELDRLTRKWYSFDDCYKTGTDD